MNQSVIDLENKMKKTDECLDSLALQVGNIEHEIFSDGPQEIEVNNLLKSVDQVKNNYQNLRKEIMEVQHLQKQLSSSLNTQLKTMQTKFNVLKGRLNGVDLTRLKNQSAYKLPPPKYSCGCEK